MHVLECLQEGKRRCRAIARPLWPRSACFDRSTLEQNVEPL